MFQGIRLAIVLLCSLLCYNSAWAQEPVYRLLDYSKGLPSNTVYNILQDSQGYVWIGHAKGLSRYNGAQLKNYSNNMEQSRALSNLEEDKYGRVWCQNFSGEMFYTSEDVLQEFSGFKSLGNYISFSIYNKNKIVTTRNNKLIYYDIDTKKISPIPAGNNNFSNTNILTTDHGIFALTKSNKQIVKITNLNQVQIIPLPEDIHPSIFLEIGSRLYTFPRFGNDYAGVCDLNGKFEKIKLQIDANIQNVVIIKDEIWIATTEGVYAFDFNLNPKWGGKPLFAEFNVSKIIEDHEGTIWISTLNMGVAIIPNMNIQILKFSDYSITKASYFSSTDKIILGTNNNKIYEFNPFNYKVNLLYDFKSRHDVVNIYNDVSNDLIWITSDKMYGIRSGTNAIELEKFYPLKDMDYLGANTYAIAGPEGVSLFSYLGDTTDNLYSNLFLNTSMPWTRNQQLLAGSEGRSKCLAYERISGSLYASNYKGLFVWSPRYKSAITDSGRPIYASDIFVKGTKVYVSTYSGSLFVIENKKIIRSIYGFSGMRSKSITSIASFGDNLWLLYENAIVKFNIYTEKYIVIRGSDGLPNAEIMDLVVFNNKVFLATRLGLVMFPEILESSRLNPKLQFEDVFVNNTKVVSKDFNFDLKTSQNNLQINFSLNTFRANLDLNIFYQINDKNWVALEPQSRQLNLVGIAPGKYNIKLKVVKPDGTEIFSPKHLIFNIASPIWSRWWFILFVVLLLGFLSYSFMRFRISELGKEGEFKIAKEKLERELQLSTLTSIKSQMNPHFVFNALNTVQAFIFTNDKDNAIDYLNKFSDLTRMILDMSSREKVALSEEIKALNLYLELEKKRFEDNFEYSLVVNENVSAELIQIPSMLIQPYVENAIKHGLLHKTADRKLRIEFLREEESLIVFIDDNGIGRKKSFEMKLTKPSGHKSFATEANKKRLQLLNQGRKNIIDIEYLDKVDSFGNSQGTMVILAIPVNF